MPFECTRPKICRNILNDWKSHNRLQSVAKLVSRLRPTSCWQNRTVCEGLGIRDNILNKKFLPQKLNVCFSIGVRGASKPNEYFCKLKHINSPSIDSFLSQKTIEVRSLGYRLSVRTISIPRGHNVSDSRPLLWLVDIERWINGCSVISTVGPLPKKISFDLCHFFFFFFWRETGYCL